MLYQYLMLSWGVDVSRYISQLGSWFSAIFEVMVRLCWKKYHFLLIFGDRCFADPFAWYDQVDHWRCETEECVCRTFWKVSKYPLPQLIFAFKSKSMLLKKCILIPYRTPVFLFEVALPLCNYHFDCAYWCTGVPVSSFMLVGASGLTTRKICFVFKGRSCMPNRSYHGLGWCSRWVNMHNKQV